MPRIEEEEHNDTQKDLSTHSSYNAFNPFARFIGPSFMAQHFLQ